MLQTHTFFRISIFCLSALSFCSAASAMQPVLVEIKKDKTGCYNYIFKIKVDETSVIKGGAELPDPDFFTIYNFGGLVEGSAKQPAGWTFSSSTSGRTPIRDSRTVVNPLDIVGSPNVTWSRTGSDISGPSEIKGFSVCTTVKETMSGEYASQVTRKNMGPVLSKPAPEETKEARIGSIPTPQLVKTPGATR